MWRVAVLLICCVTVGVGSPLALRSGDPAVDGKDYLLSDVEFRSLLTVARQALQKKYPSVGIYRIHVVSATKVEAFYGDSAPDGIGSSMDVERSGAGWRASSIGRPTAKIVFSP